jgi:ribulose-phosphate 3-epimerase
MNIPRKIEISPSILSADFANLEKELNILKQAKVERIHLDIMDGHFVPNITFGPPLVECIRKKTDIFLESHLMITDPEKYIIPFKEAGSDLIIFHKEVSDNPIYLIDKIKNLGIQAGISINPDTEWEEIGDLLPFLDMVLIMSVHPGFGGQKYIPKTAQKMRFMLDYIKSKNLNIDIGIDGGINSETVKDASKNGANIIIAGSYLFNSQDIIATINFLRSEAEKNYAF